MKKQGGGWMLMGYKKTAPSIPAKSGCGTNNDCCTSRESKGSEISLKAKRERQLSILVDAFSRTPLTMLQVAKKTGIERASICRRVAELRRQHSIYICGKRTCPISHDKAAFYTTSPKVAYNYYCRCCAPILSGLRGREKALVRKGIFRIVNDGASPSEARNQLPIDLFAIWFQCCQIIAREGDLTIRLRDMNPEQALAYCTNRTTPVWCNAGLGQDEVIELWRIFRDYITHNYQETSIPIPARLKDIWESCKNIIDKESQL